MFPLPSKQVGIALAMAGGLAGFWWHPSPLQLVAVGLITFLVAAVLHESGIVR